MKKHFKYIFIAAALLLFASLFCACNLIGFTTEIRAIEFEQTQYYLDVGEKLTPAVKVIPEGANEKYTLTSSDSGVLSVDGKAVKGESDGIAELTVTSNINKLTAMATVRVGKQPLSGLTIVVNGDAVQYYDAEKSPVQIEFSVLGGENEETPQNVSWTVKVKGQNQSLEAYAGDIFSYTMPNTAGRTYVVSAVANSSENKSYFAEIEIGLYHRITSITLEANFPETLVMGEEYGVFASLNDKINPSAVISWYVKPQNGAPKLIQQGKGLKIIDFVPDLYGVQTLYAEAEGVKSDSVEFSAVYGAVKDVTISAKDFGQPNGTFKISVGAQTAYVNPQEPCMAVLYVDGETAAEINLFTTRQINYIFEAEGEYVLKIVCGEAESAEITVTIQREVPAAAQLEIETSGQTQQFSKPFTAVNFTVAKGAEYLPDEIKWYVNGAYQTGADGTAYSLNLAERGEGEYTVTAKLGDMESAGIVVAAITSQIKKPYVQRTFEYGGYTQNYLVTSKTEMAAVLSSELLSHGNDGEIEMYIDYEPAETAVDKISAALGLFDESGAFYYNVTSEGNVGKTTVRFDFSQGADKSPSKTTTGGTYPQYAGIPTAYSSAGRSDSYVFFADSLEKTMSVSSSNELYKAVQWGYRPVITDDTTQQIYDNAKSVLRRIVDDNMTEQEKVLAIYDWLCSEVSYDYALVNTYFEGEAREQTIEGLKYNGYYLEGVFLDGKAVCDGKSKAFVLLCALENIKAIRVVGTAQNGVGQGGAHAWNKVLLDTDGNGKREWYLADTTYGDFSADILGKTVEITTRAYFLVDDTTIVSHTEDGAKDYPSTTAKNYNFYKTQTFTYNMTEYDFYIESTAELNAVLAYVKVNKIKSLEIYIAYATTIDTVKSQVAPYGAIACMNPADGKVYSILFSY